MKNIKTRELFEKEDTKYDLLKTIESDMNDLRLDGRKANRVEATDNGCTADFRSLGRWEHDEESEHDDDGWREDDDQMVWPSSEFQKYKKKFTDWVESKKWADKVDAIVSTGEKSYAYFEVVIKPEKKKEEKPAETPETPA